MNNTKQPDCLWAAVSGLLTFILFPYSSWRPEYFKAKRLGQTHQWYAPKNKIVYSDHFSPVFSPGLPCKKNEHTGLQPLWCSLLLFLKWPAQLSCKTCDFCLYKRWFQPLVEPDRNICSILLFQSPKERLIFFQSFLGSFWVGSCFWRASLVLIFKTKLCNMSNLRSRPSTQ